MNRNRALDIVGWSCLMSLGLALTGWAADSAAIARGGGPLAPRGARTITIDGQLDDWRGVPVQGLHQIYHYLVGFCSTTRHDAAVFSMLTDDEALYVAIRVADGDIYNPFPPRDAWQGDCVELFLDLRPTAGVETQRLGAATWNDGVYQWFLVPPMTAGSNATWTGGGQRGAAPAGPLELAGAPVEGGYALEVRVPYASLKGASRARFAEPFGWDIQINDVDRNPQGLLTLCTTYCWGSAPDKYKRADAIRRFDPAAPNPASGPLLFSAVPRTLESGSGLMAAALAPIDSNEKPPSLTCQVIHERGSYEGVEKAERQVLTWPEPVLFDFPYPELGVMFSLRHQASPWDIPLGHYSLTTRWGGLIEEHRFYRNRHGFQRIAPGSRSFFDLKTFCEPPTEFGGLQLMLPNGSQAGEPLRGFIECWLPVELENEMSRRILAGEPWGRVRVVLSTEEGQAVIWSNEVPFSNAMEFEIPGAALTAGIYRVGLQVLAASGASLGPVVFSLDGTKVENLHFLTVTPSTERTIPTKLTEGRPRFRRAVKIGDPNRARFPLANQADNVARSALALQEYAGRIYVGCGDYGLNRGPIDIWSFDPADRKRPVDFVREITVEDEAVSVFRVYRDTLYVPGIDPREDWKWGNLFFKRDGVWQKRRTIPNGVHTFDVAVWGQSLWVACGTESGGQVFRSEDDGQTWTACERRHYLARRTGRFYGLLPLGKDLLIAGANDDPFCLKGNEISPMFLGTEIVSYSKMTEFKRGALFIGKPFDAGFERQIGPPLELNLFYMKTIADMPREFACFRERAVRDLVVRKGVCHVLCSQPRADAPPGRTFRGRIFRSKDLTQWEEMADFEVPAEPISLEYAAHTYFVGLGHRDWTDIIPLRPDPANEESGTLWRVGE